MPVDIPIPSPAAALDRRDAVMRVTESGSQIVEVRVDAGIPFVRFPRQASGNHWQEASHSSVLALFAADSPLATFLRTNGVSPLRQVLIDLGAPSDDIAEAAP
jgi:hypothetical protein